MVGYYEAINVKGKMDFLVRVLQRTSERHKQLDDHGFQVLREVGAPTTVVLRNIPDDPSYYCTVPRGTCII